jgi:hypothetical protein
MTRTQLDRLRRHVVALHAAKRQLGDARRSLARATTPEDAPLLIDPRWQWAQSLVAERGPALQRLPGVVGVGLGSKVSGGVDTHTPCVTILVRRKHKPDALRRRGVKLLPKALRKNGRLLPVDVVAVGAMTRRAFTSQSCSITSDVVRSGTIGAPAIDDGTGRAVFITAMHVTGRTEIAANSGVALPVRVPSTHDSPGAIVIGHVVQGSRRGIDAAKVLLASSNTVLREVPAIGPIEGWRPLTFPGDQGATVQMFGARSLVRRDGVIVHPSVFMAGFGLDAAIVVRGMATVDGDSGAALLDRERLVLGFFVGTTNDGLQIFCPAGLVLKRLGCDIPTNLD